VRIPREFEFPGDDAVMRKEGDRLIIEPAPPKSLLSVLATLSRLDENFAPILDEPPDRVDQRENWLRPSQRKNTVPI
jgi:antitoxin VapB